MFAPRQSLFGTTEPGPIITEPRKRFWRLKPGMLDPPYFCGHGGSVELVVVIARNGARQYRPCCLDCGRVAGWHFAHEALTPTERDGARVVAERISEPCARCGKLGASELHHWAPVALFPDSDKWPTAWLCVDCHVRWHQVMGTRE